MDIRYDFLLAIVPDILFAMTESELRSWRSASFPIGHEGWARIMAETWPLIMGQLQIMARLPGSGKFSINRYTPRPIGLTGVTINIAGFIDSLSRGTKKCNRNIARAIAASIRPIVEQYARAKANAPAGATGPTFII